jgi:hypothetical protein
MTRTRSLVVAFLMTLGCGLDQDPSGSQAASLVYREDGTLDPTSIPSTGPVPPGCVRIEGGQIGQAGLVVDVNGTSVTVTGWTNKEGEAEEIGFAIATSNGVAYAVKAGGETHYGNASSWSHPGGNAGPEAPGISNITFCPDTPPPGGTGTGGSGGEGGSGGGEGGSSGGEGGSGGIPDVG